jgi:uncharacterized protein DUF4432
VIIAARFPDMNSNPALGYLLDDADPTSELARNIGLARQTMAADLVTRGDGWERGVRSVFLHNDKISIEVVVDRGLDIASARIRQIPIAWRSPTEIVAPWFVENSGYGPHRGFFGGLLTTCGLDHIGHPAERSADRFAYPMRAKDALPMHGRISGTPARLSGYGVSEAAGGLEAYVAGIVTQVAIFGEHLALTRRVSINYGSATVRIEDEVANRGYASSPLAMMYHVNIGWPVVAPGARVAVAGRLLRGEGDGSIVRAPALATPERTWLFAVAPDASGRGSASIWNARVDGKHAAGLKLTWDSANLPTIVQWELASGAGHYAIGLEPSTLSVENLPDGSRFPTLEPGERRELGVRIELLVGEAGDDLLEEKA